MEIKKGTKTKLGECNFCNRRNYYVVYELGGKGVLVRVCNRCLKEAKEYKR